MIGTSRVKGVWLPTGLLAAVIACLLLAANSPAPAAASGKRCANAKATLKTASKKRVRNGLECLIAKARKKAGVRRLNSDLAVRAVSKRHARTMVKSDCFRHVCKGEGSIPTRLKRSGYLDGAKTYGFGENTGCARTPRAMVRAWMKSAYHRNNMLGTKFRDVGTGVVKGAPDVPGSCSGRVMTFSVLFTWRKG